MTGGLDGKVVVVSGGSSGIGLAVARRVAREGGAVVIGARRTGPGEHAVDAIRDEGGRALFVPADATVEEDAAALVDAAVDGFGRLDGAVNNAGGVRATGPLHELDADEWRAEVDHNLTSVFFGLKYQVPAILEVGGGSIVNNASLAGVTGVPGLAAYSAAKHGVVGLTRSVALEHATAGVRINALVTGNVDTPLYRRLLDADPDGPLPGEQPNPTRRAATPDEVASLVAYLLSDATTFITGAALPIDGGSTAS
jgi:NAD(P)-dependent dehydrogenase (short-subunit alcohol dehydrogenase family)